MEIGMLATMSYILGVWNIAHGNSIGFNASCLFVNTIILLYLRFEEK
jgi:hypothetical protein